jgi:serine/threonine-protein kinase RsbT
MTPASSPRDGVYKSVLERARRHLSTINAELVVKRALQRNGLDASSLTTAHLQAVADSIAVAARMFLGQQGAAILVGEIVAIGNVVSHVTDRVEIASERDITTARKATQVLCTRLGSGAFPLQRAVTVVSELARNIASYARRGRIELEGEAGALCVRAVDDGPGIKNLDDILAGRYRSKTGLGMGIIGVKRLSSRFAIESSPLGTRIEAVVPL